MPSMPTTRAVATPQLKDGLINHLIEHVMIIEDPPRFTNIYEAVRYFGIKRPATDPFALTSLNPTSAELGSPSFTLHVIGMGFDPASQIIWNGSAEPTTFISPTELTTEVNMATAQVAMPIPIQVQSGFGELSDTINFELLPIAPSPVITSIIPTSVHIGDPDFILRVLGTGFIVSSVIHINSIAAPTTYVSVGEVTTPVDMGLVLTPVVAPITVRNGSVVSNSVNFSVVI